MKYKNIDLSELPFYNVSEDAAKSFIDWRAGMKNKGLTQRAFTLCLIEAVKYAPLGLTPDDALDKAQLWGWQAPNYAYALNRMQNEFNALAVVSVQSQRLCDKTGNEKTHTRTLEQDLRDTSWAK